MTTQLNREQVVAHIREHGTIPAYHDCPYRAQCPMGSSTCIQQGTAHGVAFSCASARGYVITERSK